MTLNCKKWEPCCVIIFLWFIEGRCCWHWHTNTSCSSTTPVLVTDPPLVTTASFTTEPLTSDTCHIPVIKRERGGGDEDMMPVDLHWESCTGRCSPWCSCRAVWPRRPAPGWLGSVSPAPSYSPPSSELRFSFWAFLVNTSHGLIGQTGEWFPLRLGHVASGEEQLHYPVSVTLTVLTCWTVD